MKTYKCSDLNQTELKALVQRNVDPANEIRAIVEDVIANVRHHGDKALLDYAQKFDKVELQKLNLDSADLEANRLSKYQKISPNPIKGRG
jgi:histidinol dehydrogenase